MDGEPRFRRPNTPLGDFNRAHANESTKVARVIARPEVIPADELAKIHEIDELGIEFHITGSHQLPEVLDADDLGVEFHISGIHRAHDEILDDADDELRLDTPELEPVEIPLPPPRSLIPTDILEAIAAEEAELLAEEARADEPPPNLDSGDTDELVLDDDELRVVSEHADPDEALAALRDSKVLKSFPTEALEMLVPHAARHHLVDRQPAFREGAPADSFFVVEDGVLEVVRVGPDGGEVALMHVHAGEPFGLFGLLSRKVRAATVRAIGEASVIEYRAARLDVVARSFPDARRAMARFFKERLLENFLASSPLFRNLDAVGRASLISHFEDRKVLAGEVLLSPGEVQNGIALVTSGKVLVSRREGPGRDVVLATLTRGTYYGVVSALTGMPTRTNIIAPEASTLCVLPQKAFNEFVKGYPVLRTLPARLHEAGEKVERDVFVGDATALG